MEQTCQLARDNLEKVQFKKNTYYDKRARLCKFDVGDKVLLLLSTESNKLLLQWKGPYEVVEIVNRMDYRVDVDGVVGMYHANMLKQYVERKNVTLHCLLSAEANVTVNEETDTEKFGLDDCAFLTAKQAQLYNDVSIPDALTSEQRAEVKALVEQYPDVLTSVPGRTDLIQHDIKLLTSEPIQSKGYLGYQVLKIYEVYHWKDTTKFDPETKGGGLFASYINKFLKYKQKASAPPDWIKTPDDVQEYIDRYLDKEGVSLDGEKIEKNPG